ncbi:MAG: ABC transporter substrate-binding protein [Clostridia bacterium]|jgi:spermidine/putrescine-binding protein|nr:ABC transporter substrate-binding protein [Clostridia bacterium]
MKKFIALTLSAMIIASVFTGCGSSASSDSSTNNESAANGNKTLKLYNWGEYIGDNVISDFEKQYGVNVISEYYDSNEMMYTKLQAGDEYDVIIPSDYMIERLIKEGMLQKLDKNKIPNLKNLYDGVKNLAFDPDNTYSVPYFWGSVGIVYNKNNVDKSDLEKEGFGILKDTKYKGKIYMYDSERDSFMIALKNLGYSANTDNEGEIQQAYKWLQEVNDTMDPVYVTDEVIDNMANGMKDIAVSYSGDAAYIISQNPDMDYYCPKEGTNIWCDSMVIPKNAENPELANEFINYVLSYDAAYNNSETVGYASPNADVLKDMTSEGGEYANNNAYLPRSGYDKDEIYTDNEVLRQKLSELWIKVKAGK